MSSERANSTDDASGTSESGRGRSTIEFSYTPLDDAEEIVQAVHRVSGTSCDWDQLAAALGQAPRGGGFRLRVNGARIFGLLTTDRGRIELTDLGIRILDQKHVRAARAEAFLYVPLHKQVFEKIKAQILPPPPAIERMMEHMGVAPKQKDKARQVFMRSAKLAGFFDLSSERLSYPPNINPEQGNDAAPPGDQNGKGANGGNGGGGGDKLNPFIQGLLDKLPTPESDWSVTARVKWLQTAANIFDLIYQDTDTQSPGEEIEVRIKPKATGQG